MSASPAIRVAGREDLPAVLALWGVARSRHAVTADDEHVLHQLLEHDAGSLLVAEQDAALVGTLIAAWDGWRGNMYRLALAPAHRRHGIATKLVAAGERHLQARGARRVTALVGHGDDTARATCGSPSAMSSTPRSVATCATSDARRQPYPVDRGARACSEPTSLLLSARLPSTRWRP